LRFEVRYDIQRNGPFDNLKKEIRPNEALKNFLLCEIPQFKKKKSYKKQFKILITCKEKTPLPVLP
jgi:hypothetical protein